MLYGLNPQAQVMVDAGDFERLAAADTADDLRHALALYQDDYLPDSLYEDWAFHERQRLQHLYLVATERLAQELVRQGAYDETIQVCQALLARDNTWEEAYRLMMQAHAAQSNRPLVVEVYEQCAATLREQLGIEPSPATRKLLEALT
jgi:DNA-binding SARP family transcriptional activator